jgi:N-acetylneuraminate synthase
VGVVVIAEAGVNHNGSCEMGVQLIDAAARAGADAVKFQTFRAASLATPAAPKAGYQQRTTDAAESQHEMLRKLELSPADHHVLLAHARSRGIAFLSTPFDLDSVVLLTRELGLSTLKISSGDLTNAPLLLEAARAAGRVILSTGMATLAEVQDAVGVLAFGWSEAAGAAPGRAAFEAAWASAAGRQLVRERAVLLHCTTEYPAPVDEVNLRAMDRLAQAFGVPVGYSDHTRGIHIPVAAVALGAVMIEKHLTLDRGLPGPDHAASLEPDELAAMIRQVREVERALGDGIKRPMPSELGNREVARKSLVAQRALSRGEPMSLACKRPGTGRSPFDFWALDGQPAGRDYAADEAIDD